MPTRRRLQPPVLRAAFSPTSALINGLQDFLNTMLGGPVTFFDARQHHPRRRWRRHHRGSRRQRPDRRRCLAQRAHQCARRDHRSRDRVPTARQRSTAWSRLIPHMIGGDYNPGQLQIVREILYADGPDFDTAAFSGALVDYTFTVDGVATAAAGLVNVGRGHIITVTDNVGTDGVDTVRNIERLQFSDQSLVLAGLNNAPVGLLTISDATPAEDQLLDQCRLPASPMPTTSALATRRAPFRHPLPTSGGSNSYQRAASSPTS